MHNSPNNNETSVESFDDRMCSKEANAWDAHLNFNSLVFLTFFSELAVVQIVSNILSINEHFSFTCVQNALNRSGVIRSWRTPISLFLRYLNSLSDLR
jgi:hypothetical protein